MSKISKDELLSLEPAPKAKKAPARAEGKGGSGAKSGAKKKPAKKRGFLSRLFRFFLWLCLLGVLAAAGGGYALYKWAEGDLPSFSKIADYRPPLVTTVLARDGSVIGQLYRERRFLVTLDQLPKFVPQAFLAVEDDQFYKHPGVDLKAIARAAIANFQHGRTTQGGSTITQQVVKRLMLTPEKSYERKLKEAILAYRLEQQLSKDDILTLYINQIFLGNNAYGVEAAARVYFAKHASELTIAEAALIAGLGQSPSAYNPYRNPKAAEKRQQHVLRRLRDLAWISEAEYDEAVHQKLEYRAMQSSNPTGGWYLEEVRRQLVEMFSEENAAKYGFDFGLYGEDAVYELGLTVHTAMDPLQQKAAHDGLRKGLEEATKRHGWRGPHARLEPGEYDKFLKDKKFELADLDEGGWARALVTKVQAKYADVALSPSHKGRVGVDSMKWARKPDVKKRPIPGHAYVTDARKLLKEGDVVWVSRGKAPAKGQKPALPEGYIPLDLEQLPDVQGAMVSIEPETCDVVAMVGGYAFGSSGSQFNRATQAQRQPGSSFKPVVYSAALDQGFTPSSMLLDGPLMIVDKWTKEVWRPGNSDGKFLGPLPLWRGLALSRNLCTIRLVQQVGIEHVIARAKNLMLAPDFPAVLAISLGTIEVTPLNMAQAYTAFANQGKVSEPRLITNIQGPWGNTIYENPSQHVEAISPQNAYVMANLLKGVVQYGTGTRAKVLERPIAGKTGTTNDEMDAWFLAVTPHLVTATYIGYDVLQPMGRGEQGGSTALPAYIHYAKEALKAYPPDDFIRPESGLVDVQVAEDGPILPFYEGSEPGSGLSLDAMGGEDGGMDDVGSALSDLRGIVPGSNAETVPPEVLVRQKQAADRRKAEEKAQQGEDLLMEIF
ncbi:penicillin-binding protein 1A [Mailhella sp.]